ASQLRRLLAAAGDAPLPDEGDGADAERRRLVGPGGLLWSRHHLPPAREAAPGERHLPIYRALEKHDQANRNFLVIGPWRHGGWSGGPGQKLGAIDFGSPTGEYYRAK